MKCRGCEKVVKVSKEKHNERWGLCSSCFKAHKKMGKDAKKIKWSS